MLEKVPLPRDLDKSRSQDFRRYLQGELLRRSQAEPHFSLRSFARLLRVDASSLAKVLKGKRPLGQNLIRKLGERLDLRPDEIEEFVRARSPVRDRPTSDSVPPDYRGLTVENFKVISDWYHFALLEMIRLDHFKNDPKWIAKALGVPVLEIHMAIDRLCRLGILEITPDGKWIDCYEKTTNIAQPYYDSAHRKMQKQILEKAITALETVPIARRDQTSMSMAIDVEKLPQAKEKIRQFRRELARFLSRGDKRNEVYHLSVSLYPVTQASERKLK